jgi:hypothetical protein
MIAFLAEHNKMELWATDIGNAYLEAYTSEKVCIIAFGELAGHLLVIVKALYGLMSSGLRWSEWFLAVLRDMGFKASYCDPCVWMRDKGDHYEYLGVYVNDLEIASRSPNEIIQELLTTYKFKLKGTGPMTYHLGCDFTRDGDDVLVQSPEKYLERTFDEYARIFGKKPRVASSPLEKGDHPEIDTMEYLGFDDIKKYQSVIGSLQWAISLGRLILLPQSWLCRLSAPYHARRATLNALEESLDISTRCDTLHYGTELRHLISAIYLRWMLNGTILFMAMWRKYYHMTYQNPRASQLVQLPMSMQICITAWCAICELQRSTGRSNPVSFPQGNQTWINNDSLMID